MLTVVGYGYVGKAYFTLLSKGHDVLVFDPAKGYTNFGVPDGVVVCVSTPQDKDGSCYMGNVFQVLDSISDPNTPILIKSTISLEGWDQICERYPNKSITFSPEFLRAETAIEDVLSAKDMFLGGGNEDFWIKAFFKSNPDIIVHRYTPREMILAKYIKNCFLSLKVSFFNQVFDLCERTDIAYKNVRYIAGHDSRIGHSHSFISEERGFGGFCFPKDTRAMISTAKKYDIDMSLIRQAVEYNDMIRKESK